MLLNKPSTKTVGRLLWILGLLAVGIFSYFSLHSGVLRFNYPSSALYPIRGIDVSHHQGEVDWKKVRSNGVHFVYLKATEGGSFVDRRFTRNWQDAKSAGLIVGAYHFFTFCRDGASQAKNFLTVVPQTQGTLPMAIDLEYGGNCRKRLTHAELVKELQAFINAIQVKDKRKPVLYMTKEFYVAYTRNDRQFFKQYPLWIRDIFLNPAWLGDHAWTFWQYANRGRVAGIKGPVDLNVFFGDTKQWQLLLQN